MSENSSSTNEIVRLSVVHAERRIDLTVPGALPLVEILPGIARGLGVLDPALLHGGYRLDRADGSNLDPRRSAHAQGIDDGEILTLVRGHHTGAEAKYDDVVHAVIDSTQEYHEPWSPQDASRTATAVSLTLVGLAGALLLTQPAASALNILLAGVGTAVLLTLAGVLSRIHQHGVGLAFGFAGSFFGALTGFLLAPDDPLWALPALAAAAGAFLAGVLAAVITKPPIELYATPIAAGVAIAIPSGLASMGIDPVATYAITAALVGLLAGALPWLTLATTRIKVVSPMTELEMFEIPAAIDAKAVTRKVQGAHRLLIALQIASVITVLAAAPVVIPAGWLGVFLFTAAGVGFFFQARKAAVRASVMSLVLGATAVIGATGFLAIITHPGRAPALLIGLLVGAVAVTGLSLLSTKVRIRLSALTDTLEVVLLVTLLPMAVIIAGIA